jgi:hypothetical protein
MRMKSISPALKVVATAITITVAVFAFSNPRSVSAPNPKRAGAVTVQPLARDTSRPLQELVMPDDADGGKTADLVQQNPAPAAPIVPPTALFRKFTPSMIKHCSVAGSPLSIFVRSTTHACF